MVKRVNLLLGCLLLFAIYLIWQFWTAEQGRLPVDYEPRITVWMGVTWSMDSYSDEALKDLADNLIVQGVDDTYVYVSYLRADDTFNPSYDEASDFLSQMRSYAPEIRWLAWVGVPISITNDDGHQIDNRLENDIIRTQIADFAEFTIMELGFDGFHLNAELIPDSDPAFLATLALIREQLPETAFFSTTAHALRPLRPVTSIPYPHAPHHWTPEFLAEVATHVDQIALMAYDSGLPFPRDYRSWISYQTEMSASALSNSDVELLIGLPTSEEWTITHQTQAETLAHALYGFSDGFSAGIDGIALYPYWETDDTEWNLVHNE